MGGLTWTPRFGRRDEGRASVSVSQVAVRENCNEGNPQDLKDIEELYKRARRSCVAEYC